MDISKNSNRPARERGFADVLIVGLLSRNATLPARGEEPVAKTVFAPSPLVDNSVDYE